MKIFQCVQKFYEMLGVNPAQNTQIASFNLKNVLIISNLAQGFLLTAAFGLFKAKTIREYGDCYYTSTTSLSHSIYVTIHVLKMTNISKLIDKFETIIQSSEWNAERNFELCWFQVFIFSLFSQEFTIQLPNTFIVKWTNMWKNARRSFTLLWLSWRFPEQWFLCSSWLLLIISRLIWKRKHFVYHIQWCNYGTESSIWTSSYWMKMIISDFH